MGGRGVDLIVCMLLTKIVEYIQEGWECFMFPPLSIDVLSSYFGPARITWFKASDEEV